MCEELYEEPCLLACFHTFCTRCLREILHDCKIVCPLCGKVTGLKEGQFPPRDNLMVFLVESSCEERPQCANCDKTNQSAMFFCNTCGQVLCGHCREETHRARMFSLHDIIHMSKRGRESNRKCPVHGDPQIMFSTTKRSMLCINCFRESSLDARLYCVDLDTAYSQGCKKLDRAVMLPGETLIPIDTAYSQARQKLDRAAVSIRDLQGTVREGVYLFKELLDELRKNMEAEKHNINTLSDNLQETVRRTQDNLLRDVEGQYEAKDKLFRSQLSSLGSLLPIIQVHLLMCTTFSSSASKYEFLDLVFQLMERLANIAHLSHPLRPGQSSQVRSNFKSEFARSLEPLVSMLGKGREPLVMPSGSSGCSEKQSSEGGCTSRPPSAASVMAPGSSGMPGSRRSLSAAKLKIIETGGPFAEHCKSHDTKFRQEMSSKFTRLKEEAQELHRDVTLRRCLTRRGRVEEIVRECASLEDEFKTYSDEMEELRQVFDNNWEEQIQRIYAEQEVFQSQVNDVASLRDENKRLMIIAQQLEPYIRSITALMERISPKLQAPQGQPIHSSQVSVVDSSENIMQQILEQISSTCKTEQQQRAEGRGCADGASRGSGGVDDSGSNVLIGGIPKPPDPPHTRRTPDHDEDQESDHAHGFSPGPGSGRADPAHHSREGDKFRGFVSPASSMASTLASSVIGGSYMEVRKPDRAVRRKRQNSEGDSLVWERHRGCESESEMVSSTSSLRINQRRGSEGSDVEEVKKGVFMQLLEKVRLRDDKKKHDYESDVDEGRASSRERGGPMGRVVHRISRGRISSDHQTDHYLDLAAAVFDASAIPERPKSACDNTLLRAAEKLYSGMGSVRALSVDPETPNRISAERLDELRLAQARAVAKAVSRSRESSLGRARSAEREDGIRTPKAVAVPKVPQGQGRSGEFSLGEVKAIVHAEQLGGPSRKSPGRKDLETIYAVATVPRKTSSKKENIYENVPISSEQFAQLFRDESHRSRPVFKKQNSLDALPSEARKNSGGTMKKGDSGGLAEGSYRHGTLRKADSFEGHEEAVKTLVAAVQETRILRRKKTK